MLQSLNTLALLMLLGLAVASDLRTRRIPNILTGCGLLAALALRAAAGSDSFLDGLAGAGIAFALTFPLVVLGGLGGGDAKLFTAVGGFLGPADLPIALFVTALAGGAMALAMVVHRRAVGETLTHCRELVARVAGMGDAGEARTIRTPGALSIPYGVAIGIGGLVGWFA